MHAGHQYAIIAVSYTHLDVYKRQRGRWQESRRAAKRPFVRLCAGRMPPCRRPRIFLRGYTRAVSYTHLPHTAAQHSEIAGSPGQRYLAYGDKRLSLIHISSGTPPPARGIPLRYPAFPPGSSASRPSSSGHFPRTVSAGQLLSLIHIFAGLFCYRCDTPMSLARQAHSRTSVMSVRSQGASAWVK